MTVPMAKPVTRKALSIGNIEKYLRVKGWSKVPTTNPNALVYAGPKDVNGNPITVVLPASATLVDAERRLSEAVRTVATVHGRTIRGVLLAMTKPRPSGAILSSSSRAKQKDKMSPMGDTYSSKTRVVRLGSLTKGVPARS